MIHDDRIVHLLGSAEWGWNPSSFEAIGTVAAAVTALLAILISLGESARRREWDLARYARLVSVRGVGGSPDDWWEEGVELTNGGNAPIYLERLHVRVRERLPEAWPKGDMSLVETVIRRMSRLEHGVVASAFGSESNWWTKPLSFNRAEISVLRREWPQRVEPGAVIDLPVLRRASAIAMTEFRSFDLIFRDSEGFTWTRRSGGRLRRGPRWPI